MDEKQRWAILIMNLERSAPNMVLNDGVSMPQIGLGVFQVPPGDIERLVTTALEIGYRHIDTAAVYRNEEGVGRAIAASGIPRDEVFVTTKLWNDAHGRQDALGAFASSADRLAVDVIDLYLIHWPLPMIDRYVETFRALDELRQDGRIRSIGVSNFRDEDLLRLISETGITPSINQVELHPYYQQPSLRALHAELGIATEAWSPIAQGRALSNPRIMRIAEDVGRTPAQVILRWHLQLGNVSIPKSASPDRLRENFQLSGFSLSDDQMTVMRTLDCDGRIGPDPATFAIGARFG